MSFVIFVILRICFIVPILFLILVELLLSFSFFRSNFDDNNNGKFKGFAILEGRMDSCTFFLFYSNITIVCVCVCIIVDIVRKLIIVIASKK